jgi:hypothetical protein
MAKAKAKKPVKRKDGRPTRREKSSANRGMYAAAQRLERERLNAEPAHVRAHTPDDIEAVLEALMGGDTVRNKCRELGVHPGKLLMQVTADEQLNTRYTRAKQVQAHSFVEKNLDEAEQARHTIDTEADGANVELGILKHLAETRKWCAGKYHVGAYGDKVTNVLEGNPDKPLRTITSDMDDAEAIAAYQESLRNRPR